MSTNAPVDVHQLRTDLNQFRLDQNLTYRELATDIGLPEATVYRFLTQPDADVFDRTLHSIRRFLDAREVA
jgi:hypothetical protein